MYGNLQTFPRSTAKPMTDKRKSIFLLHLSRESVWVMTGTGAELVLVYPSLGDPWAAAVDSCPGKVGRTVNQCLCEVRNTAGFKGKEIVCKPVSAQSGRSWRERYGCYDHFTYLEAERNSIKGVSPWKDHVAAGRIIHSGSKSL